MLLPITSNLPKRNTVYFCFQPNDMGCGLRYDHAFNKIGIYSSLTFGSNTFANGYIKNHVKVSGGITYFNKRKFVTRHYNFVSAGISYNIYKNMKYDETFNIKTIRPLALEVGVGTIINRFSLAIRYELIKSNASIDIGFRF